MTSSLRIHQRLREATATQHATVEALPCFSKLVASDVTTNDVVLALRAFHAHHSVWEPAIHTCLGRTLPKAFLNPRRHMPALQADLSTLGLTLPMPAQPPKRVVVPEALGWLYVHEGSSLGTRLIRKSLVRALGETFVRQFAFFEGYGSRTAIMWAETIEVLERHIETSEHMERAITGAQSAFTALTEAVSRVSTDVSQTGERRSRFLPSG